MNLLIVSPSYWPAFKLGGPIQSLHILAKNLVENSIKVNVCTTNSGLGNSYKNFSDNIDGVKVDYFSYFELFERFGTTGWQYSTTLSDYLKNNIKKFDLVYILSIWNYPTAIASYYSRKHNTPYIISPRGQLYPEVLDKKNWKKYPYYKLISKRDLKFASAIHYTTHHEFEQVHSRLKLTNKEIVIPNGIDLNEYETMPQNGEFVNDYKHLEDKDIILFLGRISWKKGIDIIIKSLPNILRINNKAHLVIAGNDEDNYKNYLLNIINNLNIKYSDIPNDKIDPVSSKITFTGHLNNEDKKKIMIDSKIFVLTSHSENFGMSVVESMASNLPVLISKEVGISNEVEMNKAGLVTDLDISSVTQNVTKLLSDSELRNQLSHNANNFVHKYYNMDNISKDFIKSCNELID